MLTTTDPVHIELRDVQGKLPENKSLSHLKSDDEDNFKLEARAKVYQENMNKMKVRHVKKNEMAL
jgi:hypothetical protein